MFHLKPEPQPVTGRCPRHVPSPGTVRMPFAPSILDSAAKDFYNGYERGEYPAEFMTITFDVKAPGKKRPDYQGKSVPVGSIIPNAVSFH